MICCQLNIKKTSVEQFRKEEILPSSYKKQGKSNKELLVLSLTLFGESERLTRYSDKVILKENEPLQEFCLNQKNCQKVNIE